jgi:hypothetical protein
LCRGISATAVVPFEFVITAVEKAGNLRTAYYFDLKYRRVLFHVPRCVEIDRLEVGVTDEEKVVE